MSIIDGNGIGPEQPAAGETASGVQLLQASLEASMLLVQKLRVAESGAEAKDFSAAVLNLVQSIAVLDPTRDEKGVPLDHHKGMAKLEAETQLEKVRESSRAQASTPSKGTE